MCCLVVLIVLAGTVFFRSFCVLLPCDTMSSSQELLVLFGQRSIRRKIRPRDQSLRQVRDQFDLSQPLQHTLRRPLAPIHK